MNFYKISICGLLPNKIHFLNKDKSIEWNSKQLRIEMSSFINL